MPWPSITVGSWDEFRDRLDKLSSIEATASPWYIYRGQADESWELKPSLSRLQGGYTSSEMLKVEALAINEFMTQAHLYLPPHLIDLSDIELWSLMQHYRVPTRLLDWSDSPYVAAYFAVEDHWEKDGAVWICDADRLASLSAQRFARDSKPNLLPDEYWQKPKAAQRIFAFRRGFNTDRMVAQQGCFTICRDPLSDHGEVISGLFSKQKKSKFVNYQKIIIPQMFKSDFLRRLRSMNIAANALFPGIDGVGRSVAELIRLGSRRPNLIGNEPVPSLRSYFG